MAKSRADERVRHFEKIFELANELESIHNASILRVLKAQLGAGTPELKEACQHYLANE